jgi:hypothetical protein
MTAIRRPSALPWFVPLLGPVRTQGVTVGTKAKAPNCTLRRIREQERHESREEFARAVVAKARELGESGLACDARLVGRWEDGDVRRPRPIYQRILSSLLDRPFEELGFAGKPSLCHRIASGLLASPQRRSTSESMRRVRCGPS